MNIRDLFEKYEQNRILREEETHVSSQGNSVGCTVRLPSGLVMALDKMADHHSMTRQAIMSQILTSGIAEVIEGTFHCYTNSEDLIRDFWEECHRAAGDID